MNERRRRGRKYGVKRNDGALFCNVMTYDGGRILTLPCVVAMLATCYHAFAYGIR